MSYDFAILGGGAAGLSLALELVRSPLKDRSILIVDKETKNTNDRTWCWWTDQPTPLDGIAYHVWPKLRFASYGLDRSWDLAPFRYQMVRGIDFYQHARAELARHNVTFLTGAAEVEDGQAGVSLRVNDQLYPARWAFDSRFRPDQLLTTPRYNRLMQHFTGWIIETEEPVFDPLTFTMFDLRTPQRGGVTFFYVLPFSERRALVEYTLFSPQLLAPQEYESALRDYITHTLCINEFQLEEHESGIIPMTDQPFPRRLGENILAIGTPGGRVKASTGYAFARIQRDSARVVQSLLLHGHPFAIPPDRPRSRFFDRIILDVLAHEPQRGREIFSEIFSFNPPQRVLKFLDDRTSLLEDFQILNTPAPRPFLRALARLPRRLLLK